MKQLPDEDRCTQRVFSAGAGFNGYRCGNRAKDGEKFCGIHLPKDRYENVTLNDASQMKRGKPRTTVNVRCSIPVTDGPVVVPEYGVIPMRVQTITVVFVDGEPSTVGLFGVAVKKDGKNGVTKMDTTYYSGRWPEWVQEIVEEVKADIPYFSNESKEAVK